MGTLIGCVAGLVAVTWVIALVSDAVRGVR